jgi:hypothetical protein
MLVSRFVPWFLCHVVLVVLFGGLLIELSAMQNPCTTRPCSPVLANHAIQFARHRVVLLVPRPE